MLCLMDSAGTAQPMRYHFQQGEHIQYHYSSKAETDRMRPSGNHVFSVVREADPEFIVKDVDSLGGARMDLVIRNRFVKYPHFRRYPTYTDLIPVSEIFLNSVGKLLSGKIYVDDTLRSFTRKLISREPYAALLPDNQILFWAARQLWFEWDSKPYNQDSFTAVRSFDTAIRRIDEDAIWVETQDAPIITLDSFISNHSGRTVYTMTDTTVDDMIYSHLHYTTISIVGSTHFKSVEKLRGELMPGSVEEAVGDILFRKTDGIAYNWQINTELHNGGEFAQYSEVQISLKRIEIIH